MKNDGMEEAKRNVIRWHIIWEAQVESRRNISVTKKPIEEGIAEK